MKQDRETLVKLLVEAGINPLPKLFKSHTGYALTSDAHELLKDIAPYQTYKVSKDFKPKHYIALDRLGTFYYKCNNTVYAYGAGLTVIINLYDSLYEYLDNQ